MSRALPDQHSWLNRARHKVKLFFFKHIAWIITQLIWRSCRIHWYLNERHSSDREIAKTIASIPPHIFTLWHDSLLGVPTLIQKVIQRPFSAVISKSRDGQVLASWQSKFSDRLGHAEVISVAHDARSAALSSMATHLKAGRVIIITPDGPKGPWHQAKPGMLIASKRANAPIVTCSWQSTLEIKLPTPDGMRLPLPGSKVDVYITMLPPYAPSKKQAAEENASPEKLDSQSPAMEENSSEKSRCADSELDVEISTNEKPSRSSNKPAKSAPTEQHLLSRRSVEGGGHHADDAKCSSLIAIERGMKLGRR